LTQLHNYRPDITTRLIGQRHHWCLIVDIECGFIFLATCMYVLWCNETNTECILYLVLYFVLSILYFVTYNFYSCCFLEFACMFDICC